MKTYLVGGAVRDKILNLEAKDYDYVVVGSSEREMLELGYTKVGADFPVFLDPITNAEYALARTERKTGKGYLEFNFNIDNITIEQDLLRRDLTINAMAIDLGIGKLIDPYNGTDDLANGILRHVSEAFTEDPLRTLRVARFAARYDFTVAPETVTMMASMVGKGEYTKLSKERVWVELSKAMTEPHPALFFAVLNDSSAISEFFPDIDNVVIKHFAYLAISKFDFTNFDMPVVIAATGLTSTTLQLIKAPSQIVKFVNGIESYFKLTQHNDVEMVLRGFVGLGLFNNVNHDKWYRQLLKCHTEVLVNCIIKLDAAQSVTFADLPDDVRNSNEGIRISKAMNDMRMKRILDVSHSYN